MADPRFFSTSGPFTAGDIAAMTGAELRGPDSLLLSAVAPLDQADVGMLSFLDNRKYVAAFQASRAAACFVHPALADKAPAGMALLVTKTPYHAYAKAAQAFHPMAAATGVIHPRAVIDDTAICGLGCEIGANAVIEAGAKLGDRVRVMPNAVIGRNVEIGDDCEIGYGASISHALIGNRVRIYPGARIGQDGFGFAMGATGHLRIPQIGRVIIEDDVEIGANSTVDRGAGPDTVIGRGSMIDNLVQIGHNVQIGPYCVIIAQAGIAGSAKMEHHAVLAAQAGIAGHVTIGAGAKMGARSATMRDVPAGAEMLGAPAMPARDFWRQMLAIEKLTRRNPVQNGEDAA